MTVWFLRRLLVSLLLVFALATTVFLVVRLAPGDPLDRLAAEETTAADRALMGERFGLEGSLGAQYLRWLGGLVRGDLGTSIAQQRPVADIVGEALGPTLLLTVSAYALHLLLAVAMALALAGRGGALRRHSLQASGLVLYSLPTFWLGLLLILVFARILGWAPVGGMAAADAAFLPPPARLLDLLRHAALPVLTLALGSFMGTARFLQATLEEVLGRDHITSARARGLDERAILGRHALRNALLPLVTLVGLHLPHLLGGAVVVETVFGWPGMGRVTVEALWARDYPVIMATTLLAAVAVVAGSLLADLLYHRVDPRIARPGRREP